MVRASFLVLSLSMFFVATAAQGQDPLVPGPGLLPPVEVGPVTYIVDQTNDAIYAGVDLNDDGDINDLDEITVYYDDSSAGENLATPRFIACGPDGVLYVGDSNGDFILRLVDVNQDGDANDLDESNIYFDFNSGAAPLQAINNMVFDSDGYLIFSDNGTSSSTERVVGRIKDLNGDGVCLSVDGEVTYLYRSGVTTGLTIERPSGLVILPGGTVLVSDYESDHIYELADIDGDGAANSAGEQIPWFLSDPSGLELNFAESIALGPEINGVSPLYVNGGPVLDAIYQMTDLDGDGQILNPGETSVFWDTSQADGLIPGVAFRLAVDAEGSVFVCDGGQSTANVNDQILRLKDENADGDANDSGEAQVFLDNSNQSGISFSFIIGLAFEIPENTGPVYTHFVRGDCNNDGGGDIADAIYLLAILFPGTTGAPDYVCADACDGNDDESLDIADAITILNALFSTPATPLGDPVVCGEDPNAADPGLDCETFTSCPQP